MISKRTGNGQTECTRCKDNGKWSLTWDSFLYTFNDKPYCFNCLMEMLEEIQLKIDKAIVYAITTKDLGLLHILQASDKQLLENSKGE